MAVYQSDKQFYTTMQQLFERMRLQEPNPIDQLAVNKLMVVLRFTEPTATILVNGRKSPVSIQYGPSSSPILPDIDAQLSADVLHAILMQKISLKHALLVRKMKVSGMLWKTNSLGAILDHGRLLYPGILHDIGIN